MAPHNSPQVSFSADTEFPIQVDSLERFQSLLDSFKHKLFLTLTSGEPVSTSSTIKIFETKTYKIGKLTLKRTEKTITNPEELPNPVFNPDEYTIEDLWAVLAKQGKLRKLRVLLVGRKVKGSLATSLMSKKRRMRPIINREDTAKWLTIRKVVFDKLTEQQKAEWGLLSGLMVVSKGGRLLDPGHGIKKREEVIMEGLQLQGVPTISNRLATRPVISISSPCAYSTHGTNEYPERPGNLPRWRPPSSETAPQFGPALAALEQRVRQLEIESQFAASERAPNFTGRGRARLSKNLCTNSTGCGSWASNRVVSVRESSSSILDSEGSESVRSGHESEDTEGGYKWYVDEVGQQAEAKSQSDYRVSILADTSIGSDMRAECMSPVDWVAFADS